MHKPTAGGSRRRALIIDGDERTEALLRGALEVAGFEVKASKTAMSGLAMARRFMPDVLFVGGALPNLSGEELRRQVQAVSGRSLAIIIVTTRNAEEDRIAGFEWGADDYVLKPFSPREVALRAAAVLRGREQGRRAGALPPRATKGAGRHLVGPLEVDREGYHVFVRGTEIHLTPLEMRLLSDLMEHQGRVRSRDDLLKTVWRYRDGVTTRTTDTHIRRLRKKLGPAKILLETIRGRGYRLSVQPPSDT